MCSLNIVTRPCTGKIEGSNVTRPPGVTRLSGSRGSKLYVT